MCSLLYKVAALCELVLGGQEGVFPIWAIPATVGYRRISQITAELGLDINESTIGHFSAQFHHGDVAHLFVLPEPDFLSRTCH